MAKTADVFRAEPHDLALRLGLNVPRTQWPKRSTLADLVGAGFRWVQFHAPPRVVLQEPRSLRTHALALRELLDPTGLRLVLHAPDDLSAGTPGADRAVTGLLEYAAEAGAELIAYHGLNFPEDVGPHADTIRERALLEERSLAQHLQRAQTLGITMAIENLAPAFPGMRRMCHDPIAIRDLVRRLDAPAGGMLLDLGHLNLTCDAAGRDPAAVAAACASEVVLFHVHDNLGVRPTPGFGQGIEPLRLDLHLAPGSGTLPWDRVAGAVSGHAAPLVLEVHPQHRPDLATLQGTAAGLLTPASVEQVAA